MTQRDALVGFTGFVGGNIRAQSAFDVLVNSSNVADLRGQHFGHVVFSAARAEKWRANADPAGDQRHIDDLVDILGSFSADRLTLISTVDVYGDPIGVDEATPIDREHLHQYGRGRHDLEIAAQAMHRDVTVLRLPALFGTGLKKNVVYDLMHGNQLDRIQPSSRFQYYDVRALRHDIDRVWRSSLGTVNLMTEPVSTSDVIARVFPDVDLPERPDLPVAHYDVRTLHAGAFGRSGHYIADAEHVVTGLIAFAAGSKPAAA